MYKVTIYSTRTDYEVLHELHSDGFKSYDDAVRYADRLNLNSKGAYYRVTASNNNTVSGIIDAASSFLAAKDSYSSNSYDSYDSFDSSDCSGGDCSCD